MGKKKILFISSSGGHFAQLMKLKPLFDIADYKIITDKVPSTMPLIGKFNINFFGKKSRNKVGLIVNLINYIYLSFREYFLNKPDIIITTGSYPALPFCLIGKLFGVKVIYILSFARVRSRSRTADVLYYISDVFIVQWKESLRNYPKAIYLGGGIY